MKCGFSKLDLYEIKKTQQVDVYFIRSYPTTVLCHWYMLTTNLSWVLHKVS